MPGCKQWHAWSTLLKLCMDWPCCTLSGRPVHLEYLDVVTGEQEKMEELQSRVTAEQGEKAELISRSKVLVQTLKVRASHVEGVFRLLAAQRGCSGLPAHQYDCRKLTLLPLLFGIKISCATRNSQRSLDRLVTRCLHVP